MPTSAICICLYGGLSSPRTPSRAGTWGPLRSRWRDPVLFTWLCTLCCPRLQQLFVPGKRHFQKIRRWFFTFYGLFIAMSAVREILLLGRPLLGVASGFDVISILNVTAGAIWRNRRIQIAVLSLELLIAF